MEFGFLALFDRGVFVPGNDRCLDENPPSAKDVPIKLVDLTGAFLILGIGLGLGILCFLIELIVAKYKHEMKLRDQADKNAEIAKEKKEKLADTTVVGAKEEGKGKPTGVNEGLKVKSIEEEPVEIM